MITKAVGREITRKDGFAKVTGRAKYPSDNHLPNMVYASLVRSTIASGRVQSVDKEGALRMPGVITVLTHENTPKLHSPGDFSTGGEFAEHFFPLQDDKVHYWGQYVALVIARTLAEAEQAALKMRVDYVSDEFATDLDKNARENSSATYTPETYMSGMKLQLKRGDFDSGQGEAQVRHQAVYRTSYINHNPMEPHATVAVWDGAVLTLYETTQWLKGIQSVVSRSLGLKADQVRIISPYVGGGFGCKGFVWPHSVLAAVAAQQVGRPVKLVLSRAAMFTNVGRRGVTRQEITLGARRDGRLTAIRHATLTPTSIKGQGLEPCGLATAMLYSCPNVDVTHTVTRLNIGAPSPTRAPGEAPGTFAIESAMDELAETLDLDPIEFRIRNYAQTDEEKKLPFSGKHLLQCYHRGAELFGWERRNSQPGSLQEDGRLIGLGMATATYPANRRPASAAVRMYPDGSVVVRCATHDLGTGTYTTMAQIAADELEVPVERVRCELGDSRLPPAGVSGGSSTSASVAPAVQLAAGNLRTKLAGAEGGHSPESWPDLIKASGQPYLEGHSGQMTQSGKKEIYSPHSFGAQFAEVEVDPATRQIRVRKVVSVIDAGRILNHLTARSQIQGGVVWGIGMALLEKTELDPKSGGPITQNLADYLVPSSADVPDITVEFIEVPDTNFNSVGVRGIGEIGITGITAAIANAVYNATGVRVRELPITLDKILV